MKPQSSEPAPRASRYQTSRERMSKQITVPSASRGHAHLVFLLCPACTSSSVSSLNFEIHRTLSVILFSFDTNQSVSVTFRITCISYFYLQWNPVTCSPVTAPGQSSDWYLRLNTPRLSLEGTYPQTRPVSFSAEQMPTPPF